LSIFTRSAALLLLLGIASAPALAQRTVNRCTDAKGQLVLSDRPCASEGAASRGTDGRQASNMACTRLADTIRHAPLRGARPETVEQQAAEYARTCREFDLHQARHTAAAPTTTR